MICFLDPRLNCTLHEVRAQLDALTMMRLCGTHMHHIVLHVALSQSIYSLASSEWVKLLTIIC